MSFRLTLPLLLALATTSFAQDDPAPAPPADAPPLAVPNEQAEAATALVGWLKGRGIEAERNGNVLLFRHDGVLVNVVPSVFEGELDRLIVTAFYSPEDEFRGTQALVGLAADRNSAQNMLRVFIDGDGDFAASGSMTFFDSFTAAEFDAYLNLFATVVKQHVLTESAVKMLK